MEGEEEEKDAAYQLTQMTPSSVPKASGTDFMNQDSEQMFATSNDSGKQRIRDGTGKFASPLDNAGTDAYAPKHDLYNAPFA